MVLLGIGRYRGRKLELVVTVLTIRHPSCQDAFKNLIPKFPGTLPGTAVLYCKKGLVVGLTTTNSTMSGFWLEEVIIPLKLIRAMLGEKSLMLVGPTWLGHLTCLKNYIRSISQITVIFKVVFKLQPYFFLPGDYFLDATIAGQGHQPPQSYRV